MCGTGRHLPGVGSNTSSPQADARVNVRHDVGHMNTPVFSVPFVTF